MDQTPGEAAFLRYLTPKDRAEWDSHGVILIPFSHQVRAKIVKAWGDFVSWALKEDSPGELFIKKSPVAISRSNRYESSYLNLCVYVSGDDPEVALPPYDQMLAYYLLLRWDQLWFIKKAWPGF